ncbi:MAG: 50S ribosomal protein L28 [Clostridiales bacterium]|nr:50S ribosomal protein L28 [Clostridiales bacterium]
MGKFCQVCEKKAMYGHKVSHSNRKSNRTWAPNIQKTRMSINGQSKRINVCTSCLRTMNKVTTPSPSGASEA